MSKDIEETWVNIPANPAAKSAQSNKADTNDIDDWDKEKAELVENSEVGKILGELADWFSDKNRDWDKDMDKYHAAHDKITNLIAQETNKARLSELEMFKKIEVMDISPAVAAHISRRYKALTADKEQTP